MKNISGLFIITFLMIISFSASALADKTAVSIVAPDSVKKGSTATITIKVTHSGNNIIHYTSWISLKVNNKEIKRWEYSSFKRPENENFTREATVIVNETLNITAEGNCNLHGSRGAATHTITVK